MDVIALYDMRKTESLLSFIVKHGCFLRETRGEMQIAKERRPILFSKIPVVIGQNDYRSNMEIMTCKNTVLNQTCESFILPLK